MGGLILPERRLLRPSRRGFLTGLAGAGLAAAASPADAGFLLNPYGLAPAGSPGFSQVVLLCGFEGVNGATSFVDESSYARAVTRLDGSTISTAQFKFGASSIVCDGANDGASVADSADFEMGAGQFTAECHVRFNSLSGDQGIFAKGANSTTGPVWGLYKAVSTNKVTLWIGDINGTLQTLVVDPTAVTTGTWYHFRIDKDAANKWRLYRDGVMVVSTTYGTSLPDTAGAFAMGSFPISAFNRSLNGWLDEVRVIKGSAACGDDAGFTAPVSAWPRS